MTIKTRLIGYATAASLALAVVAGSATAQTANDKAIAKAVSLETKAYALLDVPAKWTSVARALEQAARIRGANDREAVKDLLFSGTVRLQLGDAARAQTQFVQAAEWALALGDIEAAATGYVRATAVSVRLKDPVSAREFHDKAVRLTRSPLLTDDQRTSILSHFSDGI